MIDLEKSKMDLSINWELLAVALFIGIAVKVVMKLTCGRYTIDKDLSNKTVLITGATTGNSAAWTSGIRSFSSVT